MPAGEEKYHRHVYFHRLGSDPAQDPKIFGEGRDLKDWPSVTLSPDGRWLAIEVSQGWAKSEVFLLDAKRQARRRREAGARWWQGKPALYRVAEVLNDRFYLVSNEGAPRYRVFAVDVKQARARRLEGGHPPERGDAGGDLGGRAARRRWRRCT